MWSFKPNLARQDDVVTGPATSRNAHLAAEQVVSPDLAVVRDHDLVVDLGSLADSRRPVGSSIDRHCRRRSPRPTRSRRSRAGPSEHAVPLPGDSRSHRRRSPFPHESRRGRRFACIRKASRWRGSRSRHRFSVCGRITTPGMTRVREPILTPAPITALACI